MIYVIATVTLKPGCLEDFVQVARPCIEATRKEQGCRLYDLSASVTDPERATFIEEWDSREALEAHLHSPHIALFRTANKPFVLSAKVEVIHPEKVDLV